MIALAVAVAAALALAAGAYALHRMVAPRPLRTPGKVAPYACGEHLPPDRVPVRVLFFKYTCLFLVLDVVALLLAFTLGSPPPPEHALARSLAASYGLIALTAIVVAVTE